MTSDEFAAELSDLRQAYVREDVPEDLKELASKLIAERPLTRERLYGIVRENPDHLVAVVTSVGLTREQLKNQLTHRFGTASARKIITEKSGPLMDWLCDDLQIIAELDRDASRQWTLAEVLFERRRWTSRSATRSISRGRTLENDVESIVLSSGAPYVMRTTFTGARGQTAPCDFAIPGGGDAAKIVGAVKGFNSTGSKLTDAVREITELADKRLPRQFVFAVVDGLGWLNRRADLARIVALRRSQAIDGLYTRKMLFQFQTDLDGALRRLDVPLKEANT